MKLQRKRCYVTGANGFVGSHLVRELQKRKCEVTKYNREKPNIECLDNQDFIYHLGAVGLQESFSSPAYAITVNTKFTVELLERMRRKADNGVFIFASTGSVYGEPVFSPQTESHPLNASNPYSLSKLMAEKFIGFYREKYRLKTVVLRLYNVIGNLERGVVAAFVRNAQKLRCMVIEGDGTQVRCFTHVGDVVSAFVLASEKRHAIGNVFNISGNEYISINDLAKLVGQTLGVPIKLMYGPKMRGDISSFEPSNALARLLLEFNPKHTLRNTIKELGEKHIEV